MSISQAFSFTGHRRKCSCSPRICYSPSRVCLAQSLVVISVTNYLSQSLNWLTVIVARYYEANHKLKLYARTMLANTLLFAMYVWEISGKLHLLHMVHQNKLNTPISTVKTTSAYVKVGCFQKLLLSLCENQHQPLQEVLLLELNAFVNTGSLPNMT